MECVRERDRERENEQKNGTHSNSVNNKHELPNYHIIWSTMARNGGKKKPTASLGHTTYTHISLCDSNEQQNIIIRF